MLFCKKIIFYCFTESSFSDKFSYRMASTSGIKPKPKTRHESGAKALREYIGVGKPFDQTEVPTYRAVIQQGILMVMNEVKHKSDIGALDISRAVSPLIIAQWHKSNAQFCPPVTITEKSLIYKVQKFWNRVVEVSRGRVPKVEKLRVDELLDTLFDITTCPHAIIPCDSVESGCVGKECGPKAHIQCSCPKESKIPVMELQWLYQERNKKGEKSGMIMAGGDWKETAKQQKALRNKNCHTKS